MGLGGPFSPFLLGPGWLDAAYMSYAWPDYFRVSRPAHQTIEPPAIRPPVPVKGKFLKHSFRSLSNYRKFQELIL